MQYGIKFDELILQQNDDPQIGSAAATKIGADANLGLYLKNPNYWVGVSANQLFASKFKFDGNTENIQNARHIYLTGGYRYLVNDNFALTPALLAKFVKANRPQAEINLRGAYIDTNNSNEYWLGVAYRTEDAVSILAGLDLGMGFNFAYSYDITTSKLNTVSNGSHEISLGYNFAIVK
ncbi:MAG TPA: PorP/SprF family type IX secretion system membrane protein, partial [Chitinophagales bacterium]|nr:PorP/SprF family type IX secretion system membrane protein [Chitinophagales bacterium]